MQGITVLIQETEVQCEYNSLYLLQSIDSMGFNCCNKTTKSITQVGVHNVTMVLKP